MVLVSNHNGKNREEHKPPINENIPFLLFAMPVPLLDLVPAELEAWNSAAGWGISAGSETSVAPPIEGNEDLLVMEWRGGGACGAGEPALGKMSFRLAVLARDGRGG